MRIQAEVFIFYILGKVIKYKFEDNNLLYIKNDNK